MISVMCCYQSMFIIMSFELKFYIFFLTTLNIFNKTTESWKYKFKFIVSFELYEYFDLLQKIRELCTKHPSRTLTS